VRFRSDKLRRESLKTLAGDLSSSPDPQDGINGRDPVLDSEAFQRHLRESGYSEILGQLLSPRVFEHAFFARPDKEHETALAGWNETYGMYCGRDLQAELLEAQRRLAVDMTQEAFDRFRALKMQEQTAQDQNAK